VANAEDNVVGTMCQVLDIKYEVFQVTGTIYAKGII
jgi:hypothetical protein